MEKKTIQNDLAFIKQIIEESRRNVSCAGPDLIVWGIIVIIGLLTTYYCLIQSIHIHPFLIWGPLIGLGWVFELIYNVKRKKKILVRTFAEKADGMLWLSLGISMTLLGFVGVGSGAINIEFLSAVLSIVIAVGYFVTGVLYDVKWVRNLAFGWWGGALIMFLIPGHVSLLIMALMMFLLQIIPGYIIYKKWSAG